MVWMSVSTKYSGLQETYNYNQLDKNCASLGKCAMTYILYVLIIILKHFVSEVMGETKGKKIGTLCCCALKPPVIRGYVAAFNYWFCALGTWSNTAKPLLLLKMALNELCQREIPCRHLVGYKMIHV